MRRILAFAAVLLLCGCAPKTDITVFPETSVAAVQTDETERIAVLINKNSGKYHLDVFCVYAERMAEENRLLIEVPDETYLSEHGYEPCSRCSDHDYQEK